MKRWKQVALDADAERRLRQVMRREPTSKEVSELRHGEQALGLEDVAYGNARQLRAEAKSLRQSKKELIIDLRKSREKTRRLLRTASDTVKARGVGKYKVA